MSSRPNTSNKLKICIIGEGFEEKFYMDRLEQLSVWQNKYEFTIKNAKSASNVFPMFQNEYQNDNYAVILIFCDTDKYPFKEYALIKQKLKEFFNSRTLAVNKIVIFANPCSMQIILSHFGDVELKTQAKKTNAPLIEELTGVVNYKASQKQIKNICSKITRTSYYNMKQRIEKIDLNDTITPSTNLLSFLEFFENSDETWIKDIDKSLRAK